MAIQAQTLSVTCATNKYDALSRRGVLECQLAASAVVVAASDAQTLTTAASVNDDPALSADGVSKCLLAAIQ
jgi:hypothetical protein